jgi:hypothetical protein
VKKSSRNNFEPSGKCQIKITKFKVLSKLVTKPIAIAKKLKFTLPKKNWQKETIPGKTMEPKPLQINKTVRN